MKRKVENLLQLDKICVYRNIDPPDLARVPHSRRPPLKCMQFEQALSYLLNLRDRVAFIHLIRSLKERERERAWAVAEQFLPFKFTKRIKQIKPLQVPPHTTPPRNEQGLQVGQVCYANRSPNTREWRSPPPPVLGMGTPGG